MEIYSKISGVSHHQETLKGCKVGDKLKLKRELDNQFDKNAIQVLTLDNKLLGYINKYQNKTICDMLNNNIQLSVEIKAITGQNSEFLGCNIYIYEKESNSLVINDGFTKFKIKGRFISFEFQNQIITINKEDFEKCYKHYINWGESNK